MHVPIAWASLPLLRVLRGSKPICRQFLLTTRPASQAINPPATGTSGRKPCRREKRAAGRFLPIWPSRKPAGSAHEGPACLSLHGRSRASLRKLSSCVASSQRWILDNSLAPLAAMMQARKPAKALEQVAPFLFLKSGPAAGPDLSVGCAWAGHPPLRIEGLAPHLPLAFWNGPPLLLRLFCKD